MNKVIVGKTEYEIIQHTDEGTYGIRSGNVIKTLCRSNSITGWALWGRNPAGKITMSCPNVVKFA